MERKISRRLSSSWNGELLYLDTYQKLGQAPKILESAKNIIAIDPQNLTALVLDGVLDDVDEQHDAGSARHR